MAVSKEMSIQFRGLPEASPEKESSSALPFLTSPTQCFRTRREGSAEGCVAVADTRIFRQKPSKLWTQLQKPSFYDGPWTAFWHPAPQTTAYVASKLGWLVWKFRNQATCTTSFTLSPATGMSPVPRSEEGLRLTTKHGSRPPVARKMHLWHARHDGAARHGSIFQENQEEEMLILLESSGGEPGWEGQRCRGMLRCLHVTWPQKLGGARRSLQRTLRQKLTSFPEAPHPLKWVINSPTWICPEKGRRYTRVCTCVFNVFAEPMKWTHLKHTVVSKIFYSANEILLINWIMLWNKQKKRQNRSICFVLLL